MTPSTQELKDRYDHVNYEIDELIAFVKDQIGEKAIEYITGRLKTVQV
jgi:hypothetical protein